ncbi:hypothetical protein [Flavivirga sp. 57AJ16]|uniref:hypothetical protein n=1 Tax=Flavivirga sp. 57AJ16 TaxID=3025307 RepID=UPI0023657E4A|nr:hypothetical protein [Flavivirga sp. 57AJ16]MDD7885074.1 hypothetical protein [Flavivirga sp. 57AJ16]
MGERDITKELINHGKSHTSKDFTNQLMKKIKESEQTVSTPFWHPYALAFSLFIIAGSLFFINNGFTISSLLPPVNLYTIPMFFQILAIMFVVFAVSKYINLKLLHKALQSNE